MTLKVTDSKGAMMLGGIVIVCFFAGMLTGHLVTPSSSNEGLQIAPTEGAMLKNETQETPAVIIKLPTQTTEYTMTVPDKWISEGNLIPKIIDRFDTEKLKENLRYLADKPHLAASPRDDELAHFIRDRFEEAGFDSSELIPYNILLSKPDPNNPNKVSLTENGKKIFESRHKEEPIHKDDGDPDFIHAFNAFTPAGTVTTEQGVGVVYVNYGRIEDFALLEDLGVNITNHIALVRYGKIFRGNKVRNAERNGAIGVIIFSDPEDVAAEGTSPANVYDKSFWLPGTGMQRGSTNLGDGDPLTPGWPSTEQAYRLTVEEADLHNIPAQPIGYADAREIIEKLDGDVAPKGWQGGMKGITYRLGPYFIQEFQNISLTLSTHNTAKIERSYNVIGIIKGSTEPDRYVMLGNHRDAWGYGASDPSSGTSQLLESARVFGTLLAEGWRPRRTLVFCSWGAEEFGLIGSTEWVEEHLNKLQARTIAYINTDTCASGPRLYINGSPMLWGMLHYVTNLIPGVIDPSITLYEEWKNYYEVLKPEAPEKPEIKTLGSGSDYAGFSFYAGIPSADIWFRRDEIKYNITIYPSYHTGYETFYMVSTFVDPDFRIQQGCGRLASLSIKYLADSTIIPYSISRFPQQMMRGLLESKHRELLKKIYNNYDELEKAVSRYQNASESFERNIDIQKLNPAQVRAINDQLMILEQSFIIPEGLPGRPTARHAIFAPSKFDNYASAGFPGISDLLYKYDLLDGEEKTKRENELKRHISDLTIMTDRATSLLKDVYVI